MYIGALCLEIEYGIIFSKKLGKGDSHTAEQLALLETLRIINDAKYREQIIIYCDQKALVSIIKERETSNRELKKFEKVKEILQILKLNSNIKVKWIQGKNNIAHSVIQEAYRDVYYSFSINKYKRLNDDSNTSELINNIKLLEDQIRKREVIISGLLETIEKLKSFESENLVI